jgi:hypothetical protein
VEEEAAAAAEGAAVVDETAAHARRPMMRIMTSNTLHAAVIAMAMAAFPAAAEQKTFPTPQAAMDGLIAALAAADREAVLAIFGEEYADFLTGGDEAAARVEWRTVFELAKEATVLRPDGDGRYIPVLGRRAWPMPIPIAQDQDAWRFDTGAGVEEVTNRRIGRNELAAMEFARNYVQAQRLYASADHDGDQVLEYAQRLRSTPGQQDGLYWSAGPGTGPSPLGPYVAEKSEFLEGRQEGAPVLGYHFRILTRQGANAPGGAYDYIINGNMIAGFALVAWPADYGNSGVMTFLISHQGRLLELDLGPEAEQIVAAMQAYDPDSSWTEAKE